VETKVVKNKISSKHRTTGKTIGVEEMPKSIDYHSYLIESLKDPQEAEAYLKGALSEGDLEMIEVARRNVIEAGNGDICRKYQNYSEFINSPSQGVQGEIHDQN